MILRWLIGIIVVVVTAALAAPVAIAAVTGRPLSMECVGITDPELSCEEVMDYWVSRSGGSGPITSYRFDSTGGSRCGDSTITRWGLFEEPISPLC